MPSYEETRKYFDLVKRRGYQDHGRVLVQKVLTGKTIDQLDYRELLLLCYGYNWAGDEKQSEVAQHALKVYPSSAAFYTFLWNCFGARYPDKSERYRALDSFVKNGVGDPIQWHLQKSFWHLCDAVEPPEWDEDPDWPYPNNRILNRDEYEFAVAQLRKAAHIHLSRHPQHELPLAASVPDLETFLKTMELISAKLPSESEEKLRFLNE